METEEGGKRLLKNLTGTNIALGEFGRNTGIFDVGASTGNGTSDFMRIKVVRADCVGPLRDRCGGYPRELRDE